MNLGIMNESTYIILLLYSIMHFYKSKKKKKPSLPKQKSIELNDVNLKYHNDKSVCVNDITKNNIHMLLSISGTSYWVPFQLNKSVNGIEDMFDFLEENVPVNEFHKSVTKKIKKVYGSKGVREDLIQLYKTFLSSENEVMYITLFGKSMFGNINSPDTTNDKLVEKINPTSIDQYKIVLTKCNDSPSRRRSSSPRRSPRRSRRQAYI
jgi:hypothetical protein